MKTSYFAKLKSGIIAHPVSISRFPPKWYRGPKYFKLAPPADVLSRGKDAIDGGDSSALIFDEYRSAVLAHVPVEEVVDELRMIWPNVPDDDITLLCFEPLGRPCHRHVVAEWLTSHGYPTREMEYADIYPCLCFD
jgi:hypothetical protein